MELNKAIPQGYKQTEVGVIPEDWETTNLGKLADLITSGSRGWAKYYSENGALFVRSQNVRNGQLDFTDKQYVTLPENSEGSRTRLKQQDILITITGNSVGNVASLDCELGEAFISQHVGLVRLKKPILADFITKYLSPNAPGNPQILLSQSGQSKPGLSLKNLHDFIVALPPINELNNITAALSDVDALLAQLDALIAKKRDLKQAAMQQLLTAQTRLPEFSGDWEEVMLPEVCWFQEGPGVRTHQFRASGVKLLNGTNLSNGQVSLETTNRFISLDEAYGAYAHFLVEAGDILLATSGITIDKLHEKVAIATSDILPLCMNTSTVRFKIQHAKLCLSFLFFFLQSDIFKQQIGLEATGSAQLNFGPSHLKKIKIKLPPTLEEQMEISILLEDFSAEISALEARRDKTRDLKRGMMQELLTGKTRLISAKENGNF